MGLRSEGSTRGGWSQSRFLVFFLSVQSFLCLSYALKVSNPVRSRADYEAAQEGIIREVGTFCRCKHPSLVRLVTLYSIHQL